MAGCIFCRIVKKEIPAQVEHEDERVMAFKDINPQSPVHMLVIPKKHIPSLNGLAPEDEALVGHLFSVIRLLAGRAGVAGPGYRVVVNCGEEGGQVVDHLHFHLLGGRVMGWPPG